MGLATQRIENTGFIYSLDIDTWSTLSNKDAPSGRSNHKAVCTGTEMIVWGGTDGGFLNSGGRYDPAANEVNSWENLSSTGAPSARYSHTAVWNGSEVLIWGGF